MASRDDRSRVPPRPRPDSSPSDDDEGQTEIVRRKGSEDLEMIPVEKEDEHEALAPPPPAGATEFFPIDRPDPMDDEPETTPKEREVRQRAALYTPERANGPEPAAEPAKAPAERPPLDIRGPVVPGSGPAAEAPEEAPAAPVDLRNRTRSWRLYALMLVLMVAVAMSLVVTVGVISAVVVVLQRPAPAEPVPVAAPAPVPPPPAATPIAPAVVPEVVVEEPPEPVAPPLAPRTAAVTIRLAPGSHPFVALRIDCEEPAFRKRQSFEAGVVTIPDVPRASCTASFLGGPPVRSAVRGGDDLTCSIEGTSALCR